MSDQSIVSVQEMIEQAFGDPSINTVNFKIVQTLMYLLARQLRILDRRVKVDLGVGLSSSTSVLSVSEVKIHANVPKKTKRKPKHAVSAGAISRKSDQSQVRKSISEKNVESKGDTETEIDEHTPSQSVPMPTKSKSKSRKTAESTGPKKSERTPSTLDEETKKQYQRVLDKTELEREKELRTIEQRSNSIIENINSPTPMESLSSTEVKYEKLLIVERIPVEEAQEKKTMRAPQIKELPIVTQEEFESLVARVFQLENLYGPIGVPGFPENLKLMQDLRRGSSLTEAMAALQLSARLEATEKAIENMMALVTDIAKKVPLDPVLKEPVSETKLQEPHPQKKKMRKVAPPPISETKGSKTSKSVQSIKGSKKNIIEDTASAKSSTSDVREDYNYQITQLELQEALKELGEEFHANLDKVTTLIGTNADKAMTIATRADEKIDQALAVCNRMRDVEQLVTTYVEKVNYLDTGLTSQMTIYQEQLTQMQHELDIGLENMLETLAHQGGDIEAVNELHGNFNSLNMELERTKSVQQDLDEIQQSISEDMQNIWKEIERLREMKSDREEVTDALIDKAGIEALNGMVTINQFEAVRGDIEQRIGAAYDKFNHQEVIWQKAIDELLRAINEKADLEQVMNLRDDINNNLTFLDRRLNAMLNLLGEPRAAALKKRIHRDMNCLSCSTPAYMTIDEDTMPLLPPVRRPPTIGEERKPQDSGDDGVCYMGLPVPHPIDKRGEKCARYCGGEHTKMDVRNLPESGLQVAAIVPDFQPVIGTDGKTYQAEAKEAACIPCNDEGRRLSHRIKLKSLKSVDRDETLPDGDQKVPTLEAEVPIIE